MRKKERKKETKKEETKKEKKKETNKEGNKQRNTQRNKNRKKEKLKKSISIIESTRAKIEVHNQTWTNMLNDIESSQIPIAPKMQCKYTSVYK